MLSFRFVNCEANNGKELVRVHEKMVDLLCCSDARSFT